MNLHSSMAAAFLGVSFLAMAPADALAQTVVSSFQAQYTWLLPYPDPNNPLVVGPHRVRYTLYDDGTFVNTDGNGGEWNLNGGALTLWYFSRVEATATYPPFGAATWQGTLSGGAICNGTSTSPGIDPATGYPITIPGTWNTRGCP